jgi:phospholipase/carboxylesterase
MRVRTVLLHGYGGSGEEMMRGFGPLIHAQGYECVARDAPFSCDLVPNGRQWFPLTALPNILARGVRLAADELEPQFRAESDDALIIVIGHSQGAMIAADLVSRPQMERLRAVCVAGSLSFAPEYPRKALERVMFVHGTVDKFISFAALEDRLEQSGALDRLLRVEGGAHALDSAIMSRAVDAMCALADEAINSSGR